MGKPWVRGKLFNKNGLVSKREICFFDDWKLEKKEDEDAGQKSA